MNASIPPPRLGRFLAACLVCGALGAATGLLFRAGHPVLGSLCFCLAPIASLALNRDM